MRNTFSDYLFKEAERDPNIYIVVADISPAGSMEKFRLKHPDRFINVGVAEQSMIGIAAGLALRGKKVFTFSWRYSFSNDWARERWKSWKTST